MENDIRTKFTDFEKVKRYIKENNIDKCWTYMLQPQGTYVIADIVYFKKKKRDKIIHKLVSSDEVKQRN